MLDESMLMMAAALKRVLSAPSMSCDLEGLGVDEAATLYQFYMEVERVTKRRKDELRPRLLDAVTSEGYSKEAGVGHELPMGIGKLTEVVKGAKAPNASKLKALLASKGLEVTEGFDEKITHVYSAEKVKSLMAIGRISKAELDATMVLKSEVRVIPSKKAKVAITLVLEEVLAKC